MPSLIAPTRARLTVLFEKLVSDEYVAFDPQTILFSSWFTPAAPSSVLDQVSYQYGVDAQIVRSGVGQYYVEDLFTVLGKIKYTWRSTAFGEEVTTEFEVDIVARTVVEIQ